MKDKFIELIGKNRLIHKGDILNTIKFKEVGLLPKDMVYRICLRRSKIGNSVSSALVENIKNYIGESILITEVITKKRLFLIYTNKEASILIGYTADLIPGNNNWASL